jgi:hypothetical protein
MVAYVIFIKSGRTTKESSIFTRRWLPPLSRVIRDPPPLKWSDLRYVFDIQEDCNGKEAIQA